MTQLIYVTVFLTLFVLSCRAADCETLISQQTIYATVNETLKWDMRKNFFTGEDLIFSIEGIQSYTKVSQPIDRDLYSVTNHGNDDIGTVVSLKALVSQETGAWLNDFIFMEQNSTDVDVHYALSDPIYSRQTPYFEKFRNVHKDGEGLRCFDVDFITDTKVIADCTTETAQGLTNGFLIVDLLSDFKQLQPNDNPHNYNKTSYRKIVTRNYTFRLGAEELQATAKPYLFRGEPAWATENHTPTDLDNDCELEAYKLNASSSDTVKYAAMLNKTILNKISPNPVDNFTLIDFQVEPNGDIYVLDAFYGVYQLDMLITNEFEFIQHYENPKKEQIYGFDFNYLINNDGSLTKHLVLVYKDTMVVYENFAEKASFKLPQTPVYGQFQVQMSQHYLTLRMKSSTYLYHIEEQLLLQKFDDFFVQILINPYYPDMIAINQESAYRYEFSKGNLELIKQVSTTSQVAQFTLKAQKQTGGTTICSIPFNVQVFEQNNTNVYRTSNDPFPDEITYPSKPIVVDMLASGPSLTYAQVKNNTSVDLTLDTMWQIELDGATLPDAKDIVYADMLVLDNGSRFYILTQVPSQNCTITRCINDVNNMTHATCMKIDEFPIPFILNKTKHSFSWWQEWNMVTYIYQETDFLVRIYTSAGGQSQETGKVEYDSADKTQKINAVIMIQNAIFAVQTERREVDVWRTYNPIQQIYTINQKVLEEQGYTGTFIPQNVFGSRKVHAQHIFIQTDRELLIGEFANSNNIHTFHLVKVLPIIPNSQVSVAIGPLTFTVVQKTASEQIMEEYNWINLQRIVLNKQLPLYGFMLQEPLNIDYCSQSGWLFVRAYDQTTKQTVVLLYEPNVPYHVSLHKVIPTGYNINDVFDMAIDGESQMFIYFNDNKVNKIFTVLQDAILSIKPKEGVVQYVSHFETEVQICTAINANSNGNSITVLEKIKLMNTNSHMEVKQKILDKEIYKFNFKKVGPSEQKIELDTDWYVGQPIDIFVLCKQCGDLVTIQPQIYKQTKGDDMKFVIYDGAIFDQDTLVYQSDKALIFQHKNGTFLNRIDLSKELGDGERCELLSVTSDSKHVISTVLALNGGVKTLVNECTGTTCKQYLQGETILAGVTQAIKMRFVFGRNILVLNTDPVSYSKFESSIIIYSFTTTSTSYTILSQMIINTKQLGASSTVYIADFCHVQVSESIYAILLTDINKGVFIANFGSNADGSVTELSKELINLRGYEHEQYYLKGDTHFHQLKILSQEKSDNKLKLQLLVTTSNVASYIFYFELDISKSTGASYVKQSLTLQQVLLPYGDWRSVNKMTYADNYVSITYTDGNEVVIAVYPISVKKYDTVQTISFIFGLRADYHQPLPADFVMLLSTYNNETSLFANIEYDDLWQEHTVYKYGIQTNPQLVMKNCSTLEEETMQLYAINHFNGAYGKVMLWDNDNVPPEPDNKSGSKWWWITLIVVFGVAILGVGGFFLYKKFIKKGVDPLLG